MENHNIPIFEYTKNTETAFCSDFGSKIENKVQQRTTENALEILAQKRLTKNILEIFEIQN